MKNINYLKALKIFIIILGVVAFLGLFMPYQKSIGEFKEELLSAPGEMYLDEVDLTNKDAVNLSIIENFKIYKYAMDNSEGIDWVHEEATINVVITVILIISIILVLLFAILNKNILVIIFDIVLGISSLAMNYDITSRGVMPSDNYTCGISYYLFIIIAILILISVIAIKIFKKHPEILKKIKGNEEITENKTEDKKEDKNIQEEKKNNKNLEKVIGMLKKYWYILVIVILVIVIMIILLGNKSNNSTNNSDDFDDYTNEVDDNIDKDTNNKDNNSNHSSSSGSTTGKNEKASNVEYSVFQTIRNENIMIGKNTNNGINDIEIEVEFYDKNDNFLGSSNADLRAISKNSEFAVELYGSPENYDHYKVFVDVEESDDYSYTDKLKATSNDTGEKIVGQIKNTTDDEIEYIEIAIVYYKDKKVVGHSDTLESAVKPGRTANFEFEYPYDNSYDDVEFDTYKVFINEAYTFNW